MKLLNRMKDDLIGMAMICLLSATIGLGTHLLIGSGVGWLSWGLFVVIDFNVLFLLMSFIVYLKHK